MPATYHAVRAQAEEVHRQPEGRHRSAGVFWMAVPHARCIRSERPSQNEARGLRKRLCGGAEPASSQPAHCALHRSGPESACPDFSRHRQVSRRKANCRLYSRSFHKMGSWPKAIQSGSSDSCFTAGPPVLDDCRIWAGTDTSRRQSWWLRP